jgi:hypothetical protein
MDMAPEGGSRMYLRYSPVTLFLVSAIVLASCTQYKPSSARGQYGKTNGATGDSNNATGPLTDAALVLANTKLAAAGGPLKARITFGGQTITQDFTPTGTQSELRGLKLPAATGVLTVEILQGDSVKFVAKRANTSVQSGSTVVVDDCLILRAPWAGTVNEGSCEWNITEVSN